MIRPADVYLDFCDQVPVLDEDDLELEDEAGLLACEGCPIGGGLDCPGTWRWRHDDHVVTQEERETTLEGLGGPPVEEKPIGY